MESLPIPVDGGTLDDFKEVFRVSERDFPLLFANLLLAMRPGAAACPIAAFCAEPGSRKSTNARHFRRLIDPSKAELLKRTTKPENIMLAACNSWLLAFDNLTSINQELSDLICCIVTGTGERKRTLFTDMDEIIFSVRRPIVLTSVARVIEASDLADRTLVYNVPPFTKEDKTRLDEDGMDKKFYALQPKLFGFLCSAISSVLRNQESIDLRKIDEIPRMAGLATFAQAVEPFLKIDPGTIVRECLRNQKELASDIASENRMLQTMRSIGPFEDWTSTQIYERLKNLGFEVRGEAKQIGKELMNLSSIAKAVDCSLEHRTLHGIKLWTFQSLNG